MTTSVPYLDIRRVGEALVLKFTRTDMTDAAFIARLGDEIYQIVRGMEKPKVVVDFSDVTRLSSATLGMLVALRKIVTRQEGQMRVTHIADDLIEIFKMTRLDVTLQVCGSNEAALDSFE
ncbi:MAG: anti-sigma factor antagonist [Planctomycetota bacterium]|nr:MAG: anti-sigma factor antagonist [Planctomycetota bacterium]